MKKIFLISMSLFLLTPFLVGCQNKIVTEITNPDMSNGEIGPDDVLQDSELKDVAKVISEMGLDFEMVKEMKKSIDNSLTNGFDEAVTFREILSDDMRSANSYENSNKFATKLRQSISSLRAGSSASELLQKMESGNINLYWPYAEDWDGVSMPVIAVSPEDDTQDRCLAYTLRKTEEGYFFDKEIMVDEEYAMVNPVWVINYAEIIDAPDIINIPRSISPTNNSNIGSTIKSVYLGSFKSTKQHDPWHKGGSEYYVEVASPTHKLDENGMIKILDDNFFIARISFTRKEIKKETQRDFGFQLPIVTEWQPELDRIAFLVYENDTSVFSGNLDFELSATWKGQAYGLKVKLPFGSGDDKISKLTYTRNFLFSTNNYEKGIWNTYTSDGVYWTLPFKVGTVIN